MAENHGNVVLTTHNGRASLHYLDGNGELVWLAFRKSQEAPIAAAIIDERMSLPCPDLEITFNEFASVFIQKHLLQVYSETSVGNVRSCLRSHLLPHFGEARLADIDSEAIGNFQTHLLELGLTNRSVNRSIDVLSAMLTKAVHWRYLKVNPALAVDKLPR